MAASAECGLLLRVRYWTNVAYPKVFSFSRHQALSGDLPALVAVVPPCLRALLNQQRRLAAFRREWLFSFRCKVPRPRPILALWSGTQPKIARAGMTRTSGNLLTISSGAAFQMRSFPLPPSFERPVGLRDARETGQHNDVLEGAPVLLVENERPTSSSRGRLKPVVEIRETKARTVDQTFVKDGAA
jgi:hypothetical protein